MGTFLKRFDKFIFLESFSAGTLENEYFRKLPEVFGKEAKWKLGTDSSRRFIRILPLRLL